MTAMFSNFGSIHFLHEVDRDKENIDLFIYFFFEMIGAYMEHHSSPSMTAGGVAELL